MKVSDTQCLLETQVQVINSPHANEDSDNDDSDYDGGSGNE